MKKILLLVASVAVLVSCQNKNTFTVKGTVADPAFEGKNVYVQKLVGNDVVTLDTVTIKNGAFSVKGEADTARLRVIAIEEVDDAMTFNPVRFLTEPGVITVKFDSVNVIGGTPINDAYNAFTVNYGELRDKARKLGADYKEAEDAGTMTDELQEKIVEDFNKLEAEMNDLNFSFIKDNIGNELGKHLFITTGRMFDFDMQKELIDMTDDEFKATPVIERMIGRIEKAEKVKVGKLFTDFTMKDLNGRDVSLSDYAAKGNYVLIDFWASWCAPCREEMPNVVAAYKKYKDKGFEIVGVSLDKDGDAWKKGVKDLEMTWPQMSDLAFWQSIVVDLYAFSGIPHTILLDRDGVIIEKNLRGKDLDKRLAELMPS